MDEAQDFNLEELSKLNDARHRSPRLAVLFIGVVGFCALFGFFVVFFSFYAQTHPAEAMTAYVFVACGIVIIYPFLGLSLLPYRLWATPPIRLRLVSDGLELTLATGRTRLFLWHGPRRLGVRHRTLLFRR